VTKAGAIQLLVILAMAGTMGEQVGHRLPEGGDDEVTKSAA
jgi:hypothetical protein